MKKTLAVLFLVGVMLLSSASFAFAGYLPCCPTTDNHMKVAKYNKYEQELTQNATAVNDGSAYNTGKAVGFGAMMGLGVSAATGNASGKNDASNSGSQTMKINY
jgi:hypothetical protein